MNLRDQHTVVVGLGRSGLAAARLLGEKGARVTVTDNRDAATLGEAVAVAEKLGCALELGGHQQATLDGADLIVISPGVPHTIAPLTAARANGVPVIGEVELAARFITVPIVAVTGTNGKTTATELIGEMLDASGIATFVGGNIGRALSEYVTSGGAAEVVVAEISSFQLDTMERFHPRVGVLLNISADHLDRYAGMAAYAASKARLWSRMGAADTLVYNGMDPNIAALVTEAPGCHLPFWSAAEATDAPAQGAQIDPQRIRLALPAANAIAIDLRKTRLLGPHNRENIAAAALAAMAAGAVPEGIQQAVDAFSPLPHRLEPVGSVDGVVYINDSKATNVDATVRALDCFDGPVVLIVGGRNKDNDFSELRGAVAAGAALVVANGEAGDEIAAALADSGVPLEIVGTQGEALARAREVARPGWTVLLSPACASFDQFDNYAARGMAFRKIVEEWS
ncbi:MAG: UDP-N-acetylmuramoyl-L-alanine--D-glutamate ligase [Desulfosarcinaceae bacterium]|nr:UDP-N-acetylmuramoyl-L-alanine--D-glutamate ligase [Desulfosarcinaceae bacterium]